jgi:hypothetical protein
MLEVTGGNVNDCSQDTQIASQDTQIAAGVRSQNAPGSSEFPDFM